MSLSRVPLVRTLLALFFLFTLPRISYTQTTLAAGDIAITGYHSTEASTDRFSFVLLAPITAGTVINFTDNGWLSTNVFRSGEQTVTWTSGAALAAGTEVIISGPGAGTPTVALFGNPASPGSVTGSMLSLSVNGDQILAYQGTAASPTFIAALHMNVYAVSNGDPVTTTALAWDGTANTANSSALPTGLTNGVNCLWIGTENVFSSERNNGVFNCSGTLTTAAGIRAAVNNQTNWTTEFVISGTPPSMPLPSGCAFIVGSAPTFSVNPANSSICAGANTSFTITASGATSLQWQVDAGSGFTNLSNAAPYSGVTTSTLTITAATASLNGYVYRCVATNGTGSANSGTATLTVTPLPVNPTLLAKTPASATVADGTPVSATFNAGSGGTGCTDDYRYTTDGGATFLPYTPGSNISTTGLAAASGSVFIEGRRANCSSSCQGGYEVLASWVVTPLPGGASTLNAGDIAFSGYKGHGASATTDEFSFVLLRNIGPGTTINFTNNGWLSTNVFRTGEETVTWTAPAGGLPAGTEINIAGLTATRSGGGAAGSVTGTALGLSANGDQILAYRGSAASPTFISAIHMNVYSISNGDPVTTTAAVWDGTANTTNASALPVGLTTGMNCIWIGVQDDINSEFDNARYGTCSLPATLGPIATLRAALNNPANWTKTNNDPPGFNLPTGCNYLNSLTPSVTITGTPLTAFSTCQGTASAEQSFTVSGNALTGNIVITAPAGYEVSTTSGSGFAASVNLTPSGGSVANTIIYVRITAAATGSPAGNITVTSAGVATQDVAVTGATTVPPTPADAGSDINACALTTTLAGNTPGTGIGTWTPVSGPGTANFANVNAGNSSVTVTAEGIYVFRWTIANAPCPVSFDEVTVTFSLPPTTANAGTDKLVCTASPTTTMTANAPTTGTGTWTQASGPATATIVSPNNEATNINGLGTVGVYEFVWTITNGVCPPSRDTVLVTVSPSPAPFTVTGGGLYCPSDVTLSGPVDPNYTYTWERSLSGIANPNSFTAFGGTSATQVVNTSSNYRLVVTNQFGCTRTDTASVSIADYVYNGSLAAGDLLQTGRLNRFGVVSTCAVPKPCPGIFATTGDRLYDAYTITNPRSVPVCATIGIASGCGVNMFSVAYSGSFNPAAPCTNYLADPGSSFPNVGYYEATIPANGTIVVVVHEVNPGSGCANYTLTVDVPREPALITAVPPAVTCASSSTLTASLANSYQWLPGGQTTQSIVTPPLFTPTNFKVLLGHGNNGCLDSATVTVNVTSVPPTITCPANITVSNAANQCGATVTYTATAAGTPVPALSYSFSGATTGSGAGSGSGSFFNVGTTTITLTASNACGTATCSFTVTVNDTQPPTVTCPANITVSNNANQCGAVVTYAAPAVSDNCPGATVVTSPASGSFFPVGTTTVTATATDAAGNTSSCSFTVTVNDTQPPTVTCPANITVSNAPGTCGATVTYAAPTASDNCPGVTVTTVPASGSVFPVGTTTVTATATDAAGNTSTCSFTVTVNDIQPPTLTCPAPVTVSCVSAVPVPNINSVTGLSDNCPGTITVTHRGDVISAQTCTNRYTITRTYRATDAAGNFAECTQVITVNDQTPPTLTCPAPVTVSCASAVPAPNIASVTGVSDNCGGTVTVTHISDVISAQTCANRYTITRTYRATDVCGNFAECTQIITVNDQTPPVITACPAPVTVSCASAVPAVNTALVTATDNCAGTVTITHVSDVISNQTCANRYTLTRTYRATDVCGNFTNCVQVITVNDQTAPVITCPANITVTTPVGSCTAVVNFTVTATDNCGTVTVTSVPASGSVFPIGTSTVTSTATDACGNTSTCTFTVTVNDAQLPVITAQPANRSVCAGTPASFSVTAITSPNANGPLSYQWQSWNGTAWTDISGATAATYTINSTTVSQNNTSYRVRVIGLCTTVISNHATLQVNPIPTVSITPSIPPALLPGQTLTLTAQPNPAGGGSYQWQLNGANIAGATSQSLEGITVDRTGLYRVIYTDGNGCVGTSAALEVTAKQSGNLWVYPNPNQGIFNIRFYNRPGEEITVRVLDNSGREVHRQKTVTTGPYTNIQVNLNRQPVASESYIVEIRDSQGTQVGAKRIIVYR